MLLALVLVYETVTPKGFQNQLLFKIIQGVLLGGIVVGIIANASVLWMGAIFDTRSILLSLAALFFGAIPAVIAGLFAIFIRLCIGGSGQVTGISVIASSVLWGLVFRHFHSRYKVPYGVREFVSLGLVTHIVMLALMLLFPKGEGFEVLKHISFPVMVIYPVVTIIMGLMLSRSQRVKQERLMIARNAENYRQLYESAPIAYQSLDKDANFIDVNQTWLKILGYEKHEVIGRNFMEFLSPESLEASLACFARFKEQGFVENVEHTMLKKNGEKIIVSINGTIMRNEDGSVKQTHCVFTDITQRRKAEKDLKSIEWMLSKKPTELQVTSPYGDLTRLNTERLILDSVGKDVLLGLVSDFLSLLDTSAAVYEKNGDYALGIFASSWCQYLDLASRNLCDTKDNARALASGKWHCHESCWTKISKLAIETGDIIDQECAGGLRLYAVPISTSQGIIGALNLGYGNPPTDDATLSEIAAKYQLPIEDLKQRAGEYLTRPPFIIDQAKHKLHIAARIIAEIVERKNTELSLIKAQEELNSYFNNALDLFCIADTDGYFHKLNNSWTTVLGYSLEDLSHARFLDFIHPDDYESTLSIVGTLKEQKEVLSFINRYRHKDGSYRWIEWRSYPSGKLIYAAARDITDRFEYQKTLQKSEAKYRQLVETAYEGIWMLDRHGTIVYVNDRVKDMLGFSREEMLGKSAEDFIFFDEVEDHREKMQARSRGISGRFERRLLKKDGSILWVLISSNPLYNDLGEFDGNISMHTDITEQKVAEEQKRIYTMSLENQVQDRTAQLQNAYKELESFSYSVAHDLRQPLRSISGFTTILKEDFGSILPLEAQKYLSTITRNAEEMDFMIKALLELSQLERNLTTLRPVNMQEIVSKILDSVLDNDVRSTFMINIGDLPIVMSDYVLINSVWQNLISNAVKFTLPKTERSITIDYYRTEEEIIFFVRDSGVGFNDKYKEKLFGVFQRLHRKDQFDGTGIGLAIVKKIINRHNGNVWAESKLGEGSTFYFSLPLQDET